jgi:hypothetical protein
MVTALPNCATLKQLNDVLFALISLPRRNSLAQRVYWFERCNLTLRSAASLLSRNANKHTPLSPIRIASASLGPIQVREESFYCFNEGVSHCQTRVLINNA